MIFIFFYNGKIVQDNTINLLSSCVESFRGVSSIRTLSKEKKDVLRQFHNDLDLKKALVSSNLISSRRYKHVDLLLYSSIQTFSLYISRIDWPSLDTETFNIVRDTVTEDLSFLSGILSDKNYLLYARGTKRKNIEKVLKVKQEVLEFIRNRSDKIQTIIDLESKKTEIKSKFVSSTNDTIRRMLEEDFESCKGDISINLSSLKGIRNQLISNRRRLSLIQNISEKNKRVKGTTLKDLRELFTNIVTREKVLGIISSDEINRLENILNEINDDPVYVPGKEISEDTLFDPILIKQLENDNSSLSSAKTINDTIV